MTPVPPDREIHSSSRKPARDERKAAPARIVGDTRQSGRAALERPRPGTGGNDSHADPRYFLGDGLDGFARWFADWWLRRGEELDQQARRDG